MAYSTISKSSSYMNTKLFTGNGSTNAITGVGFQPDLTWLKSRSGANDNQLYDAIRGATYYLRSESNDAQGTAATGLTAFDTDGYTLGSAGTTNNNGANMCSWNWKANGSGSSNSDGTITSTVSVDSTSKFSIVKWAGSSATGSIGHGLGVKPSLVIIKNLGTATHWLTWFDFLSNTEMLYLDLTNATGTGQTYFNSQTPTSSVIYLNNGVSENQNDMIAYCFAEVKGFSKFGTYTANNNADGPFVYCGFKPSFVVVKRISTSGKGWVIMDDKRVGYNPDNDQLLTNASDAEFANDYINLLANGFKIIDTNQDVNNPDGGTYAYMAFGQPIVSTNNDIATAR